MRKKEKSISGSENRGLCIKKQRTTPDDQHETMVKTEKGDSKVE